MEVGKGGDGIHIASEIARPKERFLTARFSSHCLCV